MFKVECPGCKAPYQVDERRVPAAGLKMRCPKCGTSFEVQPPPADPRAPAVLGFGGADGESGVPPIVARDRPPPKKGTIVGVAPPLARPGQPAQRAATANLAGGTKPAIPLPKAGRAESDVTDLPATKRPGKPAEAEAPAALSELDLPTVQPTAPPRDVADLPSLAKPRGALAAAPPSPEPDPFALAEEAELPSPAVRPRADLGRLEEPRGPRPAGTGVRTLQGHAELPRAPAAADPFADLPALIDLPARGDAPAEVEEAASFVDLPSPVRGGDLPARRSPAPSDPFDDLPEPVGPDPFGDFPARADRFNDLPSPVEASAFSDLPLPAGELALPSPSAQHGAIDLPSPAHVGLPAARDGFSDLPMAFGGSELPSLAAELPSPGGFGELDLPVVGAGLPSPAADLPETQPGLPAEPEDVFGDFDPFGEPAPFEGSGAAARRTPDPFGGSAQTETYAEPDPFATARADPFGAAGQSARRAAIANETGQGTAAFSEAAFSDGATSEPPVQPQQRRATPSADDLAIVRQTGGGTEYGEVNLDGVEDGSLVSLGESHRPKAAAEFGEFAQEPKRAPMADARAPKQVRLDAAAGEAVAEIQARKRKRRLRFAVAGLFLTALGGGSLALVPSVGPFGAYFAIDHLRQGEYERLLSATVAEAQRELSADTYTRAKAALALAEGNLRSVPRYKPLKSYAAYLGFSAVLRFGAEPEVYARAKVLLDELKEENDVDKLALARATQAAADGQLARARQTLERLAQADPRDIDVLIVRAEVELRARDPQTALRMWDEAAKVEASSRTAFGRARAQLARQNTEEAQGLANAALTKNPRHAGSRILLCRIAWQTKQDEKVASRLLGEVLGQAQHASPDEIVQAETLAGEIHLNRGRVSQAEESFGRALKINPKAARALSGFGDALFRAGRYSQALARFKASTEADPDDIVAKVGVAKASIQLERFEEAKAMLDKLRKSHPNNMDVAYWFGRVQEALGDRKVAEQAYRDSINAGTNNPEAVHAYVALANLQSQEGALDAANATLVQARQRLPASPAIHKAIGRVAMSQGRYSDGLVEFENALKLDQTDIDARFLVGTSLSRMRQFDKALATFEAVGKVDRDYPGLALERGLLFQESGRAEEALREYEAALAKAPNDPDLMLRVGCGKAAAGSGAEAEKVLRKVLSQRPNSAETHHCLGRALLVRNTLPEALKQFERAVQLDPNRAEYHLYVGYAANELGQAAQAARALEKALEIDRGLADAYWQRGVLHLRQTRAKDAVKDLLKALELRPSRFEAHAELAQAYYDLGMEAQAMQEWEKAIEARPDEPLWHFRYGKLLNLNLRHADAATHLRKAVELVKAADGRPPWLAEAHRLAAHSLGNNPAAVEYWQAFLRTGPADSPYRADAKAALARLGRPWDED